MNHFIATDEAGYGPNLGPLVIGATRWQSENEDIDFARLLSECVFDSKSRLNEHESKSSSKGLLIADSKTVYTSGNIELLERGVLASLYAIHKTVPGSVGELLQLLGLTKASIQDSEYFQCRETPLPLANDAKTISTIGHRMKELLLQSNAALQQLSVTTVFPRRFNASIEIHGNKASCLTAESLQLVADMMNVAECSDDDRFDIRCDKHGGRNRYVAAIQEYFGDSWVTIEQESRPCSRYRFRNGRAAIEFTAKGEAWLPIALASMCAKYVREIFMMRWNGFWQVHMPHLKPTKGYPVDARRFKKDIAAVQSKIGIPDNDIWRMR